MSSVEGEPGSTVLVTGGAGFIGSAVCRHLVGCGYRVVNLDKLTYAGNLESLADIENSANYRFVRADIADEEIVAALLREEMVDAIVHLAAESHVDRSIDYPAPFIETNVVGTYSLLRQALVYWETLPKERRTRFRFVHSSTDEVYGDLPFDGSRLTEESPYAPSSPYAASKAGSDQLVRAWHRTYGLPALVTNSSNNFGPFQFPEKLVPLVILNAVEGRPIPIYGNGANVRDWLYVEDNARALECLVRMGRPGETYLIGRGGEDLSNLEVVHAICSLLDRKRPLPEGRSYAEQIEFVADRPGHDRRYAVDPSKISRELGWSAQLPFENALEQTVDWYLANASWWQPLRETVYDGARLGLR